MEDTRVAALEQLVEELTRDNAALLKALRLAQLGGVDLQGHLSKFNPDAAEQGIFSQDWELRYFVLSGTLLKYYTSERDVGRSYRGLVSLEGCAVQVEEPSNIKGPFIFRINNSNGDILLRLSADRLAAAKTWVRALHTVGLRVRGFKHLLAVSQPGWQPQQQQQGGLAPTGALSRNFASLGRALSGRWSSVIVPGQVMVGDSINSSMSMSLHQASAFLQQQDMQQHGQLPAAASGSRDVHANTDSSGSTALLQQRLSIRPHLGQLKQQDASDDDGDDVISSEDESPRLSRLRRKCRWLKRKLHLGGDSAAPDAATAVGSEGLPISMSMIGTGSTATTAAAGAAAPVGLVSSSGSRRHRRTLSAPLQQQVSWKFERHDPTDEVISADRSDSSLSDGSNTEDSDSEAELTVAASLQHLPHTQSYDAHTQPHSQHHHQHHHHHQQQLPDEPSSIAHHTALTRVSEQGEEELPKRPHRISAFGAAAEAAAIAAADGISDVNPAAAAAAAAAAGGAPAGPPTPPPVPSAGLSAAGRSGARPPGIGMASAKPQTAGVAKHKRAMVGCSPVHVSAKDSILTEHDRYGVMRHEGFLNLGVVVLLATNIRMILGNLMTYGLRLKVNRAVLHAVLPMPLSHDDIIMLVAIPGSVVLFALGALLVERLGLWLLAAQEKAQRGLQKKGLPPKDVAAAGAKMGGRHEAVLLLLNLVIAGGSLVLPCCVVWSNQSSLAPAFVLTVVAIVMSMKLATYAHCNTTLRQEARTRANETAAAGLPVALTPQNPAQVPNSIGSITGRGARIIHRMRTSLAPRSMLAPAGVLATAATTTGASTAASAAHGPAALRSTVTEPHPFLAAGLSRSSSMTKRQAAGAGVVIDSVAYPGNLTAADLAYYLAAPTLTYQLNFPRLRQRRWRLLSRWLLLALLTGVAMSFMQIQFLLPCMQSSLVPLREMNYMKFMERLLRLAAPNTGVWLAMFYLVFHLWLNIVGELLLFGDRMFYKEWWNAATLADYWKLWNLPVHKWMLRTIYFPLVRRGAPRLMSLLFVFLISAVMHELAVGIPLRMLRGWAFWGMMAQVPLIVMTELLRKRLKADTLGNMVFWASFCVLGQPMCLVLYYHDWLLANMGEQGWHAVATEGDAAAVRFSSGTFNNTLSTVAGPLAY